MTIDLYDDVLMPFVIGLLIAVGFTMVGVLIFLMLEESMVAVLIILAVLIIWSMGFPVWRKYKYG